MLNTIAAIAALVLGQLGVIGAIVEHRRIRNFEATAARVEATITKLTGGRWNRTDRYYVTYSADVKNSYGLKKTISKTEQVLISIWNTSLSELPESQTVTVYYLPPVRSKRQN